MTSRLGSTLYEQGWGVQTGHSVPELLAIEAAPSGHGSLLQVYLVCGDVSNFPCLPSLVTSSLSCHTVLQELPGWLPSPGSEVSVR